MGKSELASLTVTRCNERNHWNNAIRLQRSLAHALLTLNQERATIPQPIVHLSVVCYLLKTAVRNAIAVGNRQFHRLADPTRVNMPLRWICYNRFSIQSIRPGSKLVKTAANYSCKTMYAAMLPLSRLHILAMAARAAFTSLLSRTALSEVHPRPPSLFVPCRPSPPNCASLPWKLLHVVPLYYSEEGCCQRRLLSAFISRMFYTTNLLIQISFEILVWTWIYLLIQISFELLVWTWICKISFNITFITRGIRHQIARISRKLNICFLNVETTIQTRAAIGTFLQKIALVDSSDAFETYEECGCFEILARGN